MKLKKHFERWMEPAALRQFPAVELIAAYPECNLEYWQRCYMQSGGRLYEDRMIAFPSDAIWERMPLKDDEGLGWRSIDRDECERLDVAGTDGTSLSEYLEQVLRPSLKKSGLDPEFVKQLKADLKADEAKHGKLTMSQILKDAFGRRQKKWSMLSERIW